MLLDTIVL